MKTNHGRETAGASPAFLVNTLTAADVGREVDRILATALNTANTTVYDRAIDGAYLATHVGGSRLHHLVDGRHDLAGALAAAQTATGDDSTAQAALGTAHHLAKDLFSVMGLPVVSVAPATYANASKWIRLHLGIPLSWQADLMQINGMELLGEALSTAAVVFGARQADSQMLAEIAGGSGLAGTLAANPLAMIAAAAALVLAWRLHVTGESWDPLVKRAAVGGAAAAAGVAVGTVLGGFAATGTIPLLLSIAISLAAGLAVRHLLRRRAGLFPAGGETITVPEEHGWRLHLACRTQMLHDELNETAALILRRTLA